VVYNNIGYPVIQASLSLLAHGITVADDGVYRMVDACSDEKKKETFDFFKCVCFEDLDRPPP
jgi:hypothetical protein